MKDLYRRLGSEGPLDQTAVERALRDLTASREDLNAAAAVLGSRERKREYDDAWRALSLVAMLRSRLLLQHTSLWTSQPCGDFQCLQWSNARAAQCLPFDGATRAKGHARRDGGVSAPGGDGYALESS